ncbi:hypothetical protein [Hyphomicrobium sp. CS1BSMeth3]|uniref:hypothetical protein n=1 Tax=Hyphomicrobium sp. CS1BSMeth3 TaxID=1892844 RepID=UPI000931B114|nr:hypothetical protein [Hyphomicrobium sp. CS1BSMeth3]
MTLSTADPAKLPKSDALPTALRLGYVLTVIWIACVTFYTWRLAPTSIWSLNPNELGDFAAGAAAPLAFLWLVVAVFLQKEELALQRRELELSREALRDQARETGKLVEQSTASVLVATQALDEQRRKGSEEEGWAAVSAFEAICRETSERTCINVFGLKHHLLRTPSWQSSMHADAFFSVLETQLRYLLEHRSVARLVGHRDRTLAYGRVALSTLRQIVDAADRNTSAPFANRVEFWQVRQSFEKLEAVLSWVELQPDGDPTLKLVWAD